MNRPIFRSLALTVSLMLALSWLGGCGAQSPTPAGNNSTGGQTASPTPTPLPQPVSVVGSVSVVSDSVGGPGYEGAVVFHVKNPNGHLAAVDVPFRFTVSTQGKIVYTSDGTDHIDIGANTTRLVVATFRPGNLMSRPDAATVQLYSDPSLFRVASSIPDATKWRVERIQYSCGQFVECQVTGDLTWQGADVQEGTVVLVAVHQGTSANGPVLAAGDATTSGNSVAPNQTVPVDGLLFGFEQPQGFGYAAQLPTGPLTAEVYVESSNEMQVAPGTATP